MKFYSTTSAVQTRSAGTLVILVISMVITSFIFAGTLRAQSVDTLQKQIQDLLATVSQLQQQLLSLQGSSLPTTSFSFNNNVTLGDEGNDVLELQKVLNRNIATRVAASGPGSSGNETIYFGPLTKMAVVRFQEFYRDEILTPIGLFIGTGYVGPHTIKKLNELVDGTSISSTVPSTSSQSQELPLDISQLNIFKTSDELTLSFPSLYEGAHGTELTIFGSGFTQKDNTVHFDSNTITSISSQTGSEITFTISQTIPAGAYDIFVTNTKGRSSGTVFFSVTDVGASSPVINFITPTEGLYGEEVTITGTGFTQDGNNIRTSYGVIERVASADGKTLTFRVLPAPEVPELQVGVNLGQGIEWPIWIYVANENGISASPGKFLLKI